MFPMWPYSLIWCGIDILAKFPARFIIESNSTIVLQYLRQYTFHQQSIGYYLNKLWLSTGAYNIVGSLNHYNID